MNPTRLLCALTVLAALCVPVQAETPIRAVIQQVCVDCHSGDSADAGLRLDSLSETFSDPIVFEDWVAVFDRVDRGEMPPTSYGELEDSQRKPFLQALGASLRQAESANYQQRGRTRLRRLNRTQYENTLRDLLALPNLEVREMLPPDAAAHGFDNVGSAQDMSYIQLSRYLEAATEALDQAMRLEPPPESQTIRRMAKENGRLKSVVEKQQEAVPVDDAVGLLRQPNTAQAPWWWSKVDLPVDGMYRIRMKSFGFLFDKGTIKPADRQHALTLQAVQQTTKRTLGTFDVGPSSQQATVHDFTTFLRRGDSLEFWLETLDDRNKGKTPLEEYVAPGVAVEWIEVEGPLVEQWPPASYRILFGDLPIEPWQLESGLREPPLPMIVSGVGKRAQRVQANRNKTTLYHVVSNDREADAKRLLNSFAERAFRRPVDSAELEDIHGLVQQGLDDKLCFQEAMKIGFQAILCSPEFLFLQEKPGRLDQYALASRLSYFLWNSMPDDELRAAAAQGDLNDATVLRGQTERMLKDPKSKGFVEDFCGQWLDLRRITLTQPDEQLYPEFDSWLLCSMVDETYAYFWEMLTHDLSVDHLIDSEFIMVNGRLAEHYGLSGVKGTAFQRVNLPDGNPRGGLLTQASILKVTANGTSTSPVTRGAWVLDRLCGQPVPPPPSNVEAVEPDLRGTTTIREQLTKHRDVESCAVCHRQLDPPGFALESFDVIGGWRDRYRSLEVGDKPKPDTTSDRPVRYKLGPAVDSSGTAPTGEPFDDVQQFRAILLKQREMLGKNMAERLLTYATGAGVGFTDRDEVDNILEQTHDSKHGLRSLIHTIVQSETFQSK
ncbi:DUF1592 domain-containing protein [Bremerella sp.]|uniref:DUF1592 domain-containing protein n=1 Tax=Bremerella sp. TaxID=2795602 RepID=UPI00391D619D